jgi:hypothetical protein
VEAAAELLTLLEVVVALVAVAQIMVLVELAHQDKEIMAVLLQAHYAKKVAEAVALAQ